MAHRDFIIMVKKEKPRGGMGYHFLLYKLVPGVRL